MNEFTLTPPRVAGDDTGSEQFAISDGTSSTDVTVTYSPVARPGYAGLYGIYPAPGGTGASDAVNDFTSGYTDNETTPLFSMDFGSSLTDLSFDIGNLWEGIEFDNRVRIEAINANGNPVPIILTSSSHHKIHLDGSGGILDLEGEADTADNGISVLIPGPVREVSVYHFDGEDGFITGTISFNDFNFDTIICFAADTKILTSDSEKDICALKRGDTIRTADAHDAEIRWVGRRDVSKFELLTNANLRPICITQGALGNGVPTRDLYVSQQHRLLVRSLIADRVTGEKEVLIPAVKLIRLPGIFVDNSLEAISYVHLAFDQHEIIFAEGAPSESLFMGAEALKALSADARNELKAFFPDLFSCGSQRKPARPIPDHKTQNEILRRHAKNDKPVLQDC